MSKLKQACSLLEHPHLVDMPRSLNPFRMQTLLLQLALFFLGALVAGTQQSS